MPTCLFVNRLDDAFLLAHYAAQGRLSAACYGEQLSSLVAASAGTFGFRSRGLRRAGWLVADLVRNAAAMQQAWCRENNLETKEREVLAEQVRQLAPDVVCVDSPGDIPRARLEALRPPNGLLVGDCSSPHGDAGALDAFDLVLTAHPDVAARRRASGAPCHFQPYAFEPRVLGRVAPRAWRERSSWVTFVPTAGVFRDSATRFRREVVEKTPSGLWGERVASRPAAPQRDAPCDGEGSGTARFAQLADAKVVVHPPSDRLQDDGRDEAPMYEATGYGAMVLTEYRAGLDELFVLGEEIVAYRSAEECASLLRYYAAHPDKAARIASAGQARTLRDHTYEVRMRATGEVLRRHLERKRSSGA